MTDNYSNGSVSSSSSLNSSFQETEDDRTFARISAEEEKLKFDNKLGKRLSHLDSIPVLTSFYFVNFYIIGLFPIVIYVMNARLYWFLMALWILFHKRKKKKNR